MASWDEVGVRRLRAGGSLKWTAHPDALGAWVAEMDFGVPPAVTAALHRAADDGPLGYLPGPLVDRLREACASWLDTAYGWPLPADAVRVVPDVLRGLEVVLDALLEPGAPVVVPTPAYPPFLALPRLHGRRVVEVPMRLAGGRWVLDEPAVEAALAPAGGLLLLCNPHNPLGRVHTREELLRVAALVERTGGRVFADEIHAPLVYAPHRHVPYASVGPAAARHSVTAVSAAKAWNLAGLACAQVLLTDPADRERWDGLSHLATRGASTLGVVAATAAYTAGGPWLAEVLDYLAGNRALAAGLPGVGHVPPEGTYLAWYDARPRVGLAPYLLRVAGVAVTGGEDCAAPGRFRLNFALPRPVLVEALDRVATALARLAPA